MNEPMHATFAIGESDDERIADRTFCDLVLRRGHTLFALARTLQAMRLCEIRLTQPLIGRLLLESGQMEMLLDEYGARRNQHWSRFRALTASLKNFSRIGLALAHVQRRLPTYCLLAVEGDFRLATCEQLRLVSGAVTTVASALLDEGQAVGIDLSGVGPSPDDFDERLPPPASHARSCR